MNIAGSEYVANHRRKDLRALKGSVGISSEYDYKASREAMASRNRRRLQTMNTEYTAVLKQADGWWVGWVEEVPGVNCQERSKEALIASLREVLAEALEFNRQEAIAAAGDEFMEEPLAL